SSTSTASAPASPCSPSATPRGASPSGSGADCTTRPTSSTPRCSRRHGTGLRGGSDAPDPGRRARDDGPNGILSLLCRYKAGAPDLVIAGQGAPVDRRPIPGLEASTPNQGRRQPGGVRRPPRFRLSGGW